MKKIFLLISGLLLGGCLGYPEQVKPVTGFKLDRYLGKWYEIARLDHSFERGLEKVTAEYSMRPEGAVEVKNRGYSIEEKKWSDATGKAFFVDKEGEGHLKVSFFGPFYGSYVIFELEKENYEYAFISGSSTKYLWFLSRTPTVSPDLKEQFVKKAKASGFPVEDIIWVNQE